MKISEYEFKPRYSETSLSAAKKWYKDNRHAFSGTANFAVVMEDGSVSPHLCMGCHYRIGNRVEYAEVDKPGRELVITETGWERAKLPRELALVYAKYLTQTGWPARFILNPDPEDILDNGVLLSADMPASLLQNICIMTRHFHEVGIVCFRLFERLVSDGIHPDFAYLLSFNSRPSSYSNIIAGATGKMEEAAFTPYVSGHRMLSGYSLHEVRNVLAGDFGKNYERRLTGTYREDWPYLGGGTIFRDRDRGLFWGEEIMQSEHLREELSRYRKGRVSGEGYRPPNPFNRTAAVPMQPNQFTCKEMVEVVLPWFMAQRSMWEKPAEALAITVNQPAAKAA